jgi:thiol-disulfide isomerase/thioredoxin
MRTSLIIFLLAAVSGRAEAQEVKVIKFDRLHEIIETKSNEIQVINFWATWCAPCVKELPFFEALHASNDPAVRVTLINLDYADRVDKVNQYVTRKNMQAEVFLLDEIDYNSWIDKVDRKWGGAIPATLVINSSTGERKFVDGELAEGDLERIIAEVR